MSTSEVLDNIRSRIQARYSLLFLQSWEEERWENEIASLALEMEQGLVTWTVTKGAQPPIGEFVDSTPDPMTFLDQVEAYPPDHVFFVKDFQPYLSDPKVVRRLRDLAGNLGPQRKTLILFAPLIEIPIELQKDSIKLELPLPGMEEIRDYCSDILHPKDGRLDMPPEVEERVLKAILGLTLREARKALARALEGRETVDDEVFPVLVAEKRHMVQGSDLLEFYDLEAGVKDVGGLEGLKDWLSQRAEAFSNRAREQGIPLPKGCLLLGVQGCGKSLTARATAKLLSFPLVRLDASNLLSGDRGASERNMRDVLTLMETIAPAVLWLDEIEKGFAGGDADGGSVDPVMMRLIGRFLTWMDEKKQAVFVIATANSVTNLPPEMLRRGRFDELFFVDLPNYDERKDIFRIHLTKRGWKPERYEVDQLAERTAGYSGAEIEMIVVSAMLDAFGKGGILSQDNLELAREQTVPLSITMEEKIFQLREWARTRCRPATPDSRVMQMLDEEKRHGRLEETVQKKSVKEDWIELAEAGQLSAAVTEYVRRNDNVLIPVLQESLKSYMPVEGEMGLALRADPNAVLAVGLSPELSELIVKLIDGKRIYVHPTEADHYKNLTIPKLPLLKELTEDKVKRPSFLPTWLRDLPPDGGSGKFARVARIKLSR